MTAHDGKTIVIGIGNLDRGDDAAGRLVARRLGSRLQTNVEVCEHDGEMTSLLSAIENATGAYLVDACVSGGPAGTVHRFDAAAGPLPNEPFSLSSHGLGLAEALELARALGQLPPCCLVYAIEVASLEPGRGVSPAVAAAVEETCARIRSELRGKTSKGEVGHA